MSIIWGDLPPHARKLSRRLFQIVELGCYPAMAISLLVTYSPSPLRMCLLEDAYDPWWVTYGGRPLGQAQYSQWVPCPSHRRAYIYDQEHNYRLILTFGGYWAAGDDGSLGNYAPIEVSGLYGPGAYISWFLMMLSVLSTSIFWRRTESLNRNNTNSGINGEIIACILYLFVAAGDLVHKSIYRDCYEAGFIATAQTVWGGILFSLAAIGPNRARPLNMRQVLFYFTFWVCTGSHLFARRWMVFDYIVMPRELYIVSLRDWVASFHGPFRLLLSIPMIAYYQFSANIQTNRWKFVAVFAFIHFYNPVSRILLDMYDTWSTYMFMPYENIRQEWFPKKITYSIFRPIIHPDYLPAQIKMMIPVTQNKISDLDQAATLITTVIVLIWQWKVWTLPSKLVKTKIIHLFLRSSPVEQAPVDLEDFSSNAEPSAMPEEAR